MASKLDLSEYDVKNNYSALHSASVLGITCLDVYDNIINALNYVMVSFWTNKLFWKLDKNFKNGNSEVKVVL